MNGRRFDRNADQLSQIYWHYARLQREYRTQPAPRIDEIMKLIERCLVLNDELGTLREKGLI